MIIRNYLFLSALLCCFFSCTDAEPGKTGNAEGEWHKHRLHPRYALGFTIYENSRQVRFTSRNPHDTTIIYGEVFFDKNTDGTVKQKFHRLCLTSTTHSFLFEAIDASSLVTGMSALKYIQDSALVEKYRQQQVTDIGGDDHLNREIIVSLKPDGMMVYPYEGGSYDDYKKAGIPLLYNAEYLEENPLGRAEWIILAGLAAGREQRAADYFGMIEAAYRKAMLTAEKAGSPVSVILGKPIDNVWHVPGNSSFAAQMVRDAGGTYVFEEVTGNNVQSKPAEWVLGRSENAACWVFTDYALNDYTLAALSGQNRIFPHLGPVKKGNVFVCNSAKVDYFGKGVLEPHVMLNDMIFHLHGIPQTYSPVYFKKLR